MKRKWALPRMGEAAPGWPDWRQLVLPAACLVFMIFMTRLVVTQNQALAIPFEPQGAYVRFMRSACCFVVLASVYSALRDANFSTLIAAVGILLTVGAAYQFLFDDFLKYCVVGAVSLAAAVAVYLVSRRFGGMSDHWFHAIAIGVVVLLAANALLARMANGSRLAIHVGSITVQPGEYVKVLTMILGACAFRSRRRAFLYCGVTLLSCLVLVALVNDLGNAMVIFFMFVWTTYQLFDSRKLSVGMILAAVALVAVAALLKPHVVARFRNWTQVMQLRGDAPEQFYMIRSILFGGVTGRGLGDCANVLKIHAARHDAALGGVTAVYGIGITTIAMMGYAVLVGLPGYNRSVHPGGYLLLGQFSVYVFAQSALSLGGVLDTLPFTGVVAPLISEGANQMLCFGILLGLAAAAIHPKIFRKE